MLNQTNITKVSGTSAKRILIAPELAFSLSCKITNEGVSADETGKKIVKAGTPLAGDLEDRDTAFKVAGAEDTPVGVVLHDVEVTAGTANSQVVIFGFIDTSKLDDSVAAVLTTEMKAKLPRLTFVK